MKYKIWWVSISGGLSGEVREFYDDERTAKIDAALYDKIYPGLRHIVKEVKEDE